MITPKITTRTTWNGKVVEMKIQQGLRVPLGRIAGRTRLTAKRELKATNQKTAKSNPSKPGEPPHSIYNQRKGGHRMRMIQYAELHKGEWVVGPVRLGGNSRFFQNKPTPAIHEHGGAKRVTILPGVDYLKNLRYRKISPQRKRQLAAAISRERASGKTPKRYTDYRSWKAKRIGAFHQMTKKQKENFWVKVQAGTIIVNNQPPGKPRKETVRFPRRPFMEPALRHVIPQIPGMLKNKIK